MTSSLKMSISPKDVSYDNKKQGETNSRENYIYPNLKIGIIMPAFNEHLNIGKTLSLIPKNISDKLDTIVIDDGSTDDTVKIAKKYNTIILRHHINKGNGAAIQTGLEYCKKKNYDIIIIIDADGQHEPRYIKDFIKPIVEHDYDYVIGNRFHYYYDMGIIKKLCSRVMSLILSLILGQKISDPTMGYRALSSRVVKYAEFESKYSITLEMLFKIIPFFKSCEIPIKINQRIYGESFIKLKKYFYKTLFSFTKFYLFPIVHRYSYKYIRRDFRRKVFKMLKT
jgi:hypothetical protein